jgi:hypothetical protein
MFLQKKFLHLQGRAWQGASYIKKSQKRAWQATGYKNVTTCRLLAETDSCENSNNITHPTE